MRSRNLSFGPCAVVLAASLAAAAVPMSANAAVFSLSGDFSNAANPNGAWSFTQSASALPHQSAPVTPNTLNPAAGNGFYGAGADFFTSPFLLQTTQGGAATAPYNDNDFLAGDVIVHSTNPGAGGTVFINWTAPSAGAIDFTSSLWYAHSPVVRSNDVSVLLGANVLGTVVINGATTRANANTTLFGSNIAVNAGDVLAFRFSPTAGQQFGSLVGISETITFTAAQAVVPEPSTWAMLLIGFAGLGAGLRRQRARARLATA